MATAPESIPEASSSSSSSTATPHGSNYDVFLSFRGPDTRKTFTDHLYTALLQNGIRTFRDEEELGIGEPIRPNLLKSIQESRISIPIISPDYASSRSCLDELAKIMECKQTIGHIVLPIFYHVDVGDVKKQTGSFGQPFCKHEERFKMETVLGWRNALREAGRLKGWDLRNVANGILLEKGATGMFCYVQNCISNLSMILWMVEATAIQWARTREGQEKVLTSHLLISTWSHAMSSWMMEATAVQRARMREEQEVVPEAID